MKRALVVLFAVGCNSNAAPPPNAPPPPVMNRDSAVAPVDAHPTTLPGKEIYTALCVPCHGADLRGYKADNAPSLNTATFLESATDPYLAASISTGRPGTSMAAYGQALGGPLDDAAVTRLVEYLRAQGPKAKVLDAVKAGDAKAGEAIYTKLCVTCHGDKSSRKDALHLANPMWISQAPDAFIRYAIVNGRPGTKMIAWNTTLTDTDIDNVVSFIRTFGYKEGDATEARLPAPTGKEPLVLNPKGKDPGFKLNEDRFVSVDAANKALKAGAKMIIIDARPPSDWMRVHIKGAVSIPYHDMARLSEIPKDVWVLTYCACPHHLSGIVFDELRKQGHTKSAVLDEGINDWHKKGYPVVAADGVKPPI